MENIEIISNFHQRRGKGGRPLIVVNSNKYIVENFTNSLIEIPWGVEVVWASLTPKTLKSDSIVKKIIVCSMYFLPMSKNKIISHKHLTFCLPNIQRGCFG